MTDRIAIFGYGSVGRGISARLLAEGRAVIVAQRRAPPDLPKGATFAPCDVLDRAAVVKAVSGAGQFVVSVGFPYSGVVWSEVWPKAMGNFVAACKATGARMVFIDNLYMYGPQTGPLVETMPLADIGWKPAARSAATRICMDAAASGEALIAALRAPDFYGPGVGNSFLRDTSIVQACSGANWPIRRFSRTSCTSMPTCRTRARGGDAFGRPRFRFRSGLARSLRPDAHDARHPRHRGRNARREASHQRPAGLDAGRERNVLAPLARIGRDALPVGSALPRRRWPVSPPPSGRTRRRLKPGFPRRRSRFAPR